jgi:phosphatidylserine/phosphatidylglycerophosphate/cardiolipin synthase-like enzyme
MRRALLFILAALSVSGCVEAQAAGPAPAAPGLHRDAEIFAAVDGLLAGARRRVWVEMYEFDRPDLAGRLVAAARRGIDVRVITDPTVDVSRATAAWLLEQGLRVRFYPVDESVYQIDHVKLLLVDGRALVGGMNWGSTSARNHDYALDVRSTGAVDRLAHIFEQDWSLAGGVPAPIAPDADGPIYQTAPGAEIRSRLLQLIGSARREADVEVFVLSDPDVIAALGQARRRGVDVRILLDPNQDSNAPTCRLLRQAGVPLAWYPVRPGQKLHAKIGLFDGVLLLGSANWSVSGLSHNHELDVETSDPRQTAAFRAWFDADWALAHPWWEWWLELAC